MRKNNIAAEIGSTRYIISAQNFHVIFWINRCNLLVLDAMLDTKIYKVGIVRSEIIDAKNRSKKKY